MKKQSLVKGTIILGMAGIIAKFLGLFFRWPLVMLVGDEGVGYYQMAYPLLGFFIAVASGIPIAVSKLVSECNAVNDREGSFAILKKAIIIMSIIGFGFTLSMILFSDSIMSFLKWDHKVYYSLIGVSFAPIIVGLMSAFRGFFQGYQNMTPTAVSEIIEQIGRIVIGIGLAYILVSYGVEYSAGGATLGASVGGLFGLIYLYLKYIKVKREWGIKKVKNDTEVMSKVLRVAIPISVGAAVISSVNLIDSALVPQLLVKGGHTYKEAAVLLGQLSGKAGILVNVPLTISIALSSSIVPIISELFALNNREELKRKIEGAMNISMAIAIPSAVGLAILASPILNTIFPGHGDGGEILSYCSVAIPFMAITQTSTSVLQGTGKYIMPVINLLIGCIVKIIATIILVPDISFGINGAAIGTIVGYIVTAILNILYLKLSVKVKINYIKIFIKNTITSGVMGIFVYIAYNNLKENISSIPVITLISIGIGVIIYTLLVIAFGVVDISEVKKKVKRRRA